MCNFTCYFSQFWGFSRNGNGVIGYLDVHSYGQMWMHPWGNTVNHAGQVCERADDHDDMVREKIETETRFS